MRLIDADELKKKAKMIDWLCNKQVVSVKDIDNAPTVEQEVYITGTDYDFYIRGYKEGRKDFKHPRSDCENCDFRKFTEKFIDGIVEIMNKNDITSLEQLNKILKGGEKK